MATKENTIFRISNVILIYFFFSKIVMPEFEKSIKNIFPSQASALGLGPAKTRSSLLMRCFLLNMHCTSL